MMDITLDLIVLAVLAVFMAASAILAVTTRRMLRAATCLLFVLFGTAGIYFQLGYSFLGAVQLLIYAGGITVLYVFSVLLTSGRQGKDRTKKVKRPKMLAVFLTAATGLTLCLFLTLKHTFPPSHVEYAELDMHTIGHALMGIEKHQYLLPFEVISLLLLACIVGVILIARKR